MKYIPVATSLALTAFLMLLGVLVWKETPGADAVAMKVIAGGVGILGVILAHMQGAVPIDAVVKKLVSDTVPPPPPAPKRDGEGGRADVAAVFLIAALVSFLAVTFAGLTSGCKAPQPQTIETVKAVGRETLTGVQIACALANMTEVDEPSVEEICGIATDAAPALRQLFSATKAHTQKMAALRCRCGQ